MGAPKRKQTHTSIWLKPRKSPNVPASFRTKLLVYPGASEAFRKLGDAGFVGDLLWRQLWGLAYLKKAAGPTSQWYALPGILPSTLRRFPERVRNMANDIENLGKKIEASDAYRSADQLFPLLLPSAQVRVVVKGESNPVVDERNPSVRGFPPFGVLQWEERHRFTELPKLLRLYADYVAALDRVVAQGAPKGAEALKAMMPLEMIESARKLTGKPHTNEVATLLEAAYSAVGINETVDPRNLNMQRRRQISRKK